MAIDTVDLPATLDWRVARGADDISIVVWNAQAPNGSIAGVDFTGCTAVLYIIDDSGPLLQLSTTVTNLGSILLGTAGQGSAGTMRIWLSALASQVLDRNRYRYVLFVTFPHGQVVSPLRGNILVLSGVPC